MHLKWISPRGSRLLGRCPLAKSVRAIALNSQVIRETCSNLLKKSAYPEDAIQRLVRGWYRDCEVFPSSAAQHLRASTLRERHSFSYWDSLIVAAALDAGCSTLYSEDMQHGQVIDCQMTLINPFLPA
jgi:predicted nucleic acid-binding protein